MEESEAEMTPPLEDRDGDAESDETVEYLDGVITRTELGHTKKYDSSLTKIRERAIKDSEPYFYNKRERERVRTVSLIFIIRERERE